MLLLAATLALFTCLLVLSASALLQTHMVWMIQGHCWDASSASDRQLCDQLRAALERIHECGIVHGDIKAENILVEHTAGRPMFVDFALARHTVDKDEVYGDSSELHAMLTQADAEWLVRHLFCSLLPGPCASWLSSLRLTCSCPTCKLVIDHVVAACTLVMDHVVKGIACMWLDWRCRSPLEDVAGSIRGVSRKHIHVSGPCHLMPCKDFARLCTDVH